MKILFSFFLTISLTTSFPTWAFVQKTSNIPPELEQEAKAVELKQGALLMLKQLLVRNQVKLGFKEGDGFGVSFDCRPIKKEYKCNLIQIEVHPRKMDR